MIKNSKFNTNTNALKRRIEAHKKYGLQNIDPWVFNHINLEMGLSVLDIGCGTGKQTIPIAQIIGSSGHIFAIDTSKEALNILNDEIKNTQTAPATSLLNIKIEEIHKYFNTHVFDRILSCYALYYTSTPLNTIKTIYNILKPGGIFFFCGPSNENNMELKKFHCSLLNNKKTPKNTTTIFMEQTGQYLTQKIFNNIEIFTFENPLLFNSAESLYNYWSSYNLYDKKIDSLFKTSANKYFQSNPVFITTKRVIGIRAFKLK